MREVNFSIPNANKASVGITTALYDRRALDCTSTLPLINSLNNLAYLTTSSARIRDILTVDGGVERLVCILKEGRSKEAMEMWKWNLAFQCVVNIGVRGSEAVRTRVVEADMVPVVATILDNYIQVIEKCKERAEAEMRRSSFQMGYATGAGQSRGSRSSRLNPSGSQRSERSRRQAPPPIEIPQGRAESGEDSAENGDITPVAPPTISLSSPPERTTFSRQRQHLYHNNGSRAQFASPMLGSQRQQVEQPLTAGPLFNTNAGGFGIRPVRDVDRLPSMVPNLNTDIVSQPESPTTPSAPATSPRAPAGERRRRRPSIRHQLSISGTWADDEPNDESVPETSDTAETSPEPIIGMQTDIVMQDIADDDSVLVGSTTPVAGTVPNVDVADTDTFNLEHRSQLDGSITNPTATPTQPQNQLQNTLPSLNVNATPPNMQQTLNTYQARLPFDRLGAANLLAALPRDEDVIMSLQLLAYVSKYCNLRSYFQQSHLVPRLKIGTELKLLDPDYDPATHRMPTQEELDEEWDNEFVPKPGEKPFNIFPLIEKFTVRCSSSRHSFHAVSPQQGDTMQYWAGVVMRNLCRKDESRGGIRQCAYWQCGKWEEYTRQFAKCRRCRRTKYCSKECQKGAWGSHRFWCVAAEDGKEGDGHSSSHHRHHHSHGHHHHHREASGPSARIVGGAA